MQRNTVLIVGRSEKRLRRVEYTRRNLTLRWVRKDLIDDSLLNSAIGVLLLGGSANRHVTRRFFSETFARACDRGLVTVGVFDSAPDRDVFLSLRDAHCKENDAPSAAVLAISHDDHFRAAEVFARHIPGPAPAIKKLPIAFVDHWEQQDPSLELLLQRAFADCESIEVKPIAGGNACVGTFQVFAKLNRPANAPKPTPFFVKAGKIKDINDEKSSHREWALPFIPFHLRVGLNDERSIMGYRLGLLVSDFVDNALPLREAWRLGQAAGSLFALFETTLRRMREHKAEIAPKLGLLDSFLTQRCKPTKIYTVEFGPERIERAQLEYGLEHTPEKLFEMLLSASKKIETRWGIYHGDLHCGNVMLRRNDALVIDFGKTGDFGPITGDPALMEVSLVFGTDSSDNRCFERWKETVDDLYKDPLLPPALKDEHYPFSWLRHAVREIRHVVSCSDASRKEQLAVLTGSLLRFARFLPSNLGTKELLELSEKRRAYALVVAERVLLQLISQNGQG